MAEAPAAQILFLETAHRLDADLRGGTSRAVARLDGTGRPCARAGGGRSRPGRRRRRAPRRAFLAALSEMSLERLDAGDRAADRAWRRVPPGAVLNNLGVAHLRKADPSAAARGAYYFSKAAEADPPDADYCFNLGYAYALLRDHQAALYWLRGVRTADANRRRRAHRPGRWCSAPAAPRWRPIASGRWRDSLGWAEAEPRARAGMPCRGGWNG